MAGVPTQFGIDEADIPAAISLALRCQHVDLQGFHFHSISNDLDAQAHAELVRVYLERASSWARRFGLRLTWVNAGGGLGVNYADLERQFDWEGFTRRVDEARQDEPEDAPTLLFECGRFVAAACGYYAVEVLDLKRNHGRDYAVVRGGTHHFRLPASWQHSHPFTVLPVEDWPYEFERPELRDGRLHVVGQLCTPKDVLAKDTPVSRVRAGDILLFRYAGAYGWSISHHDFLSHPHPEHLFLETGA
jgi:diaminopimelate decarboxylase